MEFHIQFPRFRVHVITRGHRWAVIREGAARAAKIFDSKNDAVQFGKTYLEKGFDLIVHRPDATPEEWIKKSPNSPA